MRVLALTAVLVAALAGALWWVRRALRPAPTRNALGAFLRAGDRRGIPPEVVHAAFAELASWLEAPRQPHPEDDLERVYGVTGEERAEAAALVARACGRRLPPGERPTEDVTTALDLVAFVARWPAES